MAVIAAGMTIRSSVILAEKRSRFASAVTHELRTPLTTFRIYSGMLAEGMILDFEKRQLYLNTLREESDRFATLVENVLSHARLEGGRAITTRKNLRAGELLDRLSSPLERRAHDAGMTLVVDRDAARDAIVFTDRDAVGQILFNLVDNACNYARHGASRIIELVASVRGAVLEVRVRDQGPGVPAAVARKIFSPFERGERDGEEFAGGAGAKGAARGPRRNSRNNGTF